MDKLKGRLIPLMSINATKISAFPYGAEKRSNTRWHIWSIQTSERKKCFKTDWSTWTTMFYISSEMVLVVAHIIHLNGDADTLTNQANNQPQCVFSFSCLVWSQRDMAVILPLFINIDSFIPFRVVKTSELNMLSRLPIFCIQGSNGFVFFFRQIVCKKVTKQLVCNRLKTHLTFR